MANAEMEKQCNVKRLLLDILLPVIKVHQLLVSASTDPIAIPVNRIVSKLLHRPICKSSE